MMNERVEREDGPHAPFVCVKLKETRQELNKGFIFNNQSVCFFSGVFQANPYFPNSTFEFVTLLSFVNMRKQWPHRPPTGRVLGAPSVTRCIICFIIA